MGVAYNPKIVTSGLIGYLDAGNKKSYPGSGTVWTDLCGNRNGTLNGSPAFSANNKGYLNLSAGPYIAFPSPYVVLNTNTGFTIDMWIYIVDPQPVYGNFWAYWFSDGQGSFEWGVYASVAGQGKFVFKDSAAGSSITTPYIGNRWSHISFGCNALSPFLYLNSVSVNTAVNFGNRSATIINIGTASGTPISAYQSSIKFYNRPLSAAEILQNYNATKGRFGL